jgi:hypothetical protein
MGAQEDNEGHLKVAMDSLLIGMDNRAEGDGPSDELAAWLVKKFSEELPGTIDKAILYGSVDL